MATIIQREFNGIPKKAISLGSYTFNNQSVDAGIGEVLSRPLLSGSNWSEIKMGILYSTREYPSQSYKRNLNFVCGLSSGSRTIMDNRSDKTFISVGFNDFKALYESYYSHRAHPINHPSGSVFQLYGISFFSEITGSKIGTSAYSAEVGMIPNNNDLIKRKTISMIYFSRSLNNPSRVEVKIYGINSHSFVKYPYSNKDYTEGDLKAVLTSSSWPTASGIILEQIYSNQFIFNTSLYPLNSAFIGTGGGLPIEIYNWYFYIK